ncbi:unnamed protein product, partial [Discosporangium mesarthrocarpum]
ISTDSSPSKESEEAEADLERAATEFPSTIAESKALNFEVVDHSLRTPGQQEGQTASSSESEPSDTDMSMYLTSQSSLSSTGFSLGTFTGSSGRTMSSSSFSAYTALQSSQTLQGLGRPGSENSLGIQRNPLDSSSVGRGAGTGGGDLTARSAAVLAAGAAAIAASSSDSSPGEQQGKNKFTSMASRSPQQQQQQGQIQQPQPQQPQPQQEQKQQQKEEDEGEEQQQQQQGRERDRPSSLQQHLHVRWRSHSSGTADDDYLTGLRSVATPLSTPENTSWDSLTMSPSPLRRRISIPLTRVEEASVEDSESSAGGVSTPAVVSGVRRSSSSIDSAAIIATSPSVASTVGTSISDTGAVVEAGARPGEELDEGRGW